MRLPFCASFAVATLFGTSALAESSIAVWSGPPASGRHEILAQGGGAVVPAHGVYGFGGLAFHSRGRSFVGWNLAMAAGPKDTFRGLSGGADLFLWRSLRLGAGFGIAWPFDKLGGNPIVIPLPEVSVGYHFGDGRLRAAVSLTQNLFSGTRGTVGVGVGF
ncbi:MAG: hypothetical protein IOD12_15440 [Silvanigrellales bacterium]|nr:hypothetical protein [Silvanigrellales bacterium]